MRTKHSRNNPKDVHDALAGLAPDVREATILASAALTEEGIPHAVIGGIAVNAHGYVYQTTDVDFLIPDKSFLHKSRLVAMPPGPIEYRGENQIVRIDYLSEFSYPEFPGLADEAIKVDPADAGKVIPVVGLFPLVYMKLVAWRIKDRSAIIGLLQAGALDDEAFREWLTHEWVAGTQIGDVAHRRLIDERLSTLVARATQEDR